MMPEGRRYRVLGVIGKGGFGTVYRAELLGEGGFVRQVALKVLNPDKEAVSGLAQRLRDEARVLGILRHRAILQVDGLVRLDDRWTVVMEYVEGADLTALLGVGPLPAGVALEVIGEVASALHVAWTWPGVGGEPLKLIHRDLKPSNILVTGVGETKVLDFGIARANFAGREAQTKSVLFGSPGYMAPERMDFEEGPAGDVYSLGCVLFEILGAAPLGRASAAREKHDQHLRDALGPLRNKVDPSLVGLLEEMLAYEPTARPTAREVETRARELRGRSRDPWLRDWAEGVVPPLVAKRGLDGRHDFSRDVLTEHSGQVVAEEVPRAGKTMGFSLPPPDDAPVAMPPSSALATYSSGEVPAAKPQAPPTSKPPSPPTPVAPVAPVAPIARGTPPPAPRRNDGSGGVVAILLFALVVLPLLATGALVLMAMAMWFLAVLGFA